MKKLLMILAVFGVFTTVCACSNENELYILNWEEYIDEDLVFAFEEEYNCSVVYKAAVSNELMYTEIANEKLPYDIVIPSDYMIEKLYKEDLLKEIDFSALTNYSDGLYVDELYDLFSAEHIQEYKNFFVPYFWGSLGIMYSTKKAGVEEAVLANGWDVLFEHNLLPEGSVVAMYDSSRDAFAAAELYLGYSLNTTVESELLACKNAISAANFTRWGTDELKKDISTGNTDVALVYSGDFFDAYYADTESEKEIDYSIYAPTNANNVFFDGMVIPTTSENTDLAMKFIDFMLDKENSASNADAVGYCPVLASVYADIIADEENWGEIVAIDAYNPNLIIKAGGSYEVYADLGTTYQTIENYYRSIRTGN